MTEHQAVKEKDKERLKKKPREDVPLPAKFKNHNQVFLEILEEFVSMSAGHLGRINASKHQIDFTNEEFRPIHCATYRAGSTPRKCAAAF